ISFFLTITAFLHTYFLLIIHRNMELLDTSTPRSASASPMAVPASYAGELVQLQRFSNDRTKVAIWDANSAINNSYEAFTNHFKKFANGPSRSSKY
uniref:Uncharacterized protein n=1 Tax=Cyprinus carpio TaxID=7962 RepID=A0A8C2IK29_CYPCA